MTPLISTPTFQEELQDRGAALMTEGQAILDLARCLGRFEDATGQRLAVVDAVQIRADASIGPALAETITDEVPVWAKFLDPIPDALFPAAVEAGKLVMESMGGTQPQPDVSEPVPPAQEAEALPQLPCWPDEDKAKAVGMRGDGFSPSHIAKVIGRPLRETRAVLAAVPPEEGGQLVEEPAPEPAEPGEPDEPAEPASQVEPPPPAAVAPPALTMRQNRLVDHLGRLGDDFEPADDLWLVTSLAKGSSLDVIADQLGCDMAAARARFRSMLTDDITSSRGAITLDGQADLLEALKYRAGV